ncbi:MAG TPA: tetratricopeptide repeat protein, partial [Thermoanaerobaculia bacterium]
PLHRTPQLDSLEYSIRAQRFVNGDFAPPAVPAHGPGYPMFMAIVDRLSGGSLAALGVVQALLGAGLCAMVAMLGRRWFGRPAGLLAGGLLAVNGPAILVGDSILAEGLLLFLLVLSLLLIESGALSPARAVFSGASLGLAALVRPTALVLLPVLVLAVAIRRSESARSRGMAAGLLTATAVAVLAPVLVANWRATQSPFLVQGHGGLNFYIGNSPSGKGVASGRFGGSWDAVAGEALRHGVTRASDQDRYYFRKALGEIRANPVGYLRLLGRKLVLTFQAEEVRDSHSYYFFRDRIPLLGWLPGFGLLFAFGAGGAVVALRDRRLPAAAVGSLVALAGTCVLLVVGTRYRMPIVPVVATFAGLGAWQLADALRSRRGREAAVLSAVVLAAGLASHALRVPEDRRLAEEWSFTGNSLAREEDGKGAEDAYRHALLEDPAYAPAWTGLGALSLGRGDWRSAGEDFGRAVASDPGNSRAHSGLGVAREGEGRLAEAATELARARSLRPDDPDTLRALARVQAASGQWDAAGETYGALLRLTPGDSAAHLGLARVETARRRLEPARAHAAAATDLDPGNADAWLLRAVVAVDLQNPSEARQALERAESVAGRGRPPVELAWAMLERLEGKPEAAESRLEALLVQHPDFRAAEELLKSIRSGRISSSPSRSSGGS